MNATVKVGNTFKKHKLPFTGLHHPRQVPRPLTNGKQDRNGAMWRFVAGTFRWIARYVHFSIVEQGIRMPPDKEFPQGWIKTIHVGSTFNVGRNKEKREAEAQQRQYNAYLVDGAPQRKAPERAQLLAKRRARQRT
jgi:hypothetical protein